jgi:hypothetical protein
MTKPAERKTVGRSIVVTVTPGFGVGGFYDRMANIFRYFSSMFLLVWIPLYSFRSTGFTGSTGFFVDFTVLILIIINFSCNFFQILELQAGLLIYLCHSFLSLFKSRCKLLQLYLL